MEPKWPAFDRYDSTSYSGRIPGSMESDFCDNFLKSCAIA